MAKNVHKEVQALHQTVKELLQKGTPDEAIIKQLEKQGLDTHYAETILDNVYSDKQKRKDFWKLMFMGSFVAVGGVLINYYSYQVAVNTGASYSLLLWGIVVVGILMITRALILFRR